MADENEKSSSSGSKSQISDALKESLKDTMKKVMLTGVGTIFLTEETIRGFLGEIKLPKELWSGFLENANKTKSEFLTAFAKETASVLSKVDVVEETKKFLEGKKVRINLEVSFEEKKKSEE